MRAANLYSILAYFLSFCIHLHCLLCVWVVCRMLWHWHLGNSEFSCVHYVWMRSHWFQYFCTLSFHQLCMWGWGVNGDVTSITGKINANKFVLNGTVRDLSMCWWMLIEQEIFEQIFLRTWFIAILACDKGLVLVYSACAVTFCLFDTIRSGISMHKICLLMFCGWLIAFIGRIVMSLRFYYVYLCLHFDLRIQKGGEWNFHSWRATCVELMRNILVLRHVPSTVKKNKQRSRYRLHTRIENGREKGNCDDKNDVNLLDVFVCLFFFFFFFSREIWIGDSMVN